MRDIITFAISIPEAAVHKTLLFLPCVRHLSNDKLFELFEPYGMNMDIIDIMQAVRNNRKRIINRIFIY